MGEWHLMADEKPEYGGGHFVVIIDKNYRWRLTYGYKPGIPSDGFHEYRGGCRLIPADEVWAWCALPKAPKVQKAEVDG